MPCTNSTGGTDPMAELDKLYEAILSGDNKGAVAITQEALR